MGTEAWPTVAESNPIVGKGDAIVAVAAAKEGSSVCFHHDDRRSYDDSHPDFERCKNESSFWNDG